LAGITLYRLLHDIQIEIVVAVSKAKSIREVLAASCFVAGGFVTLTFYDFFALRTIGRKEVPYRTAALAGFASYAIGHNLGATVFTGGLVRLRIYSVWGLGIIDVAQNAFLTGVQFRLA